MLIHKVDDGFVFPVDVFSETLVENLKKILEPLTQISVADQILLCEGRNLEDAQPISQYGLPSDEIFVFLYDKKIFEGTAQEPKPTIFPVELSIPAVPPLPANEEFDKSPLVWQLMKFENQFYADLVKAQAIETAISETISFCRKCAFEEENQVTGLEALTSNLDIYLRENTEASFNKFWAFYLAQQQKQDKLLQSFPLDLRKLEQVKLHPALGSKHATLLDFSSEPKLRKWAEQCATEQGLLKVRVSNLEKDLYSLKELVEHQKRTRDVDLNQLKDKLQRIEDILKKDVIVRVETFVQDYKTIKERVEIASKPDLRTQGWALLEGFDDVRTVHNRHLIFLQDKWDFVKSTGLFFASSKSDLSRVLMQRLRTVVELKSRIQGFKTKLNVYQEAVNKLKEDFRQLIYVQNLPTVYKASETEVARRRRFNQNFTNYVNKVSATISKLRSDEMSKRKSFFNNYMLYLPRDLISGLNDLPPQIEIAVPPFDKNLPAIDDKGLGADDEEFTVVSDDSRLVRQLERENEQLALEIRSLRSGLNSSSTQNLYKLQADLMQSQESLTDYKKRIETLESKLSLTYSQIEDRERTVQSIQEMWEKSEQQLATLQQEQFNKSRELEKLALALSERERTIEELKIKSVMNDEAFQMLENQKRSASETINDLTAQVTKLQAELESANKKLQEEEQKHQDKLQDLESSVTSCQKDQGRLHSELEQAKKQAEELNREVKSFKQRDEQKTAEIERLKQDCQQLKKQLDDSQQQQQKVKSTLNLSESKLQLLQSEKEQLQVGSVAERASLEKKVASLEAQISQQDKRVNTLNQELEQSKITIKKLENEKMQAVLNLETSHAQALKVRDERELALKKEKEKLGADLKNLTAEVESLKKNQGSSSKADLQKLVEEKTKLEQEKDKLEQKFIKATSALDVVGKSIKDSQEEKKKIEQELETCKSQLTILQIQLDDERKEKRDQEGLIEAMKVNRVKPRFALDEFKVGDYALFQKNEARGGYYEAVNDRSPNYFLAPEVLEGLKSDGTDKKGVPVFAQIVEIRSEKVTNEKNVYLLKPGTLYYEVVAVPERTFS